MTAVAGRRCKAQSPAATEGQVALKAGCAAQGCSRVSHFFFPLLFSPRVRRGHVGGRLCIRGRVRWVQILRQGVDLLVQ